ncbi:MAG: nucleotidyltransferase [Chitinophagaceae bacterium]|nr:nucleotidyltransferase [Chitinophagaceae bacterium]
MINLFTEEHQKLLSALINARVDFMLIGGYAVIHYGYDRNTGDMDIWIKAANENRNKLVMALKEFGIMDEDLKILSEMDFTNPVPVFYFGNEPRRIDFISQISNVSFEEAIRKVNFINMESLQVPVINYTHLIASKLTSTRMKDKADIEELERINKYRKKQ